MNNGFITNYLNFKFTEKILTVKAMAEHNNRIKNIMTGIDLEMILFSMTILNLQKIL